MEESQTELSGVSCVLRLYEAYRIDGSRADMTIALMKEGEEKKKELALKQFDDELARIDREERDRLKALQNAQKNGMAVTPEQVATVKDQAARQRNLAGEQYMEDYYAISKEYADKDKKLKEEEEQSWI